MTSLRDLLGDPFDPQGSSFSALVHRIPGAGPDAVAQATGGGLPDHPEGTTIVAATYADGVVMGGDRRATAGHLISKRDMRKIYPADDWSAVGISGSAGPAMEMAKLFATELEHYEKVNGHPLSLDGKANQLARMVRANLPLAMQGLIVIPLYAGFDRRAGVGRIYTYDGVGGRYAEQRFAATGSGGQTAYGSLKARYAPGLAEDDAVGILLEALWDAADEDSGTGGPDPVRQIFPLVATITADGYAERDESEVSSIFDAVIARRRERH